MSSKLTPDEYSEIAKKAEHKSSTVKDCIMAFLVGGFICTIGEALISLYMRGGMARDVASTLSSITLIFIAALLTGLHAFDNIAKYAGAGTLVPITGFSNSMAAPALDFKSEGFILGLGVKMFSIAGPVIVYGISAGIIYGIIIYLFKLY
ncbi:stage V sporulation protein AC [Acetanaerobacterium elongatum]|uniref:Stage V sporulation protein AC n=1 Tax=Acetanaerobacterium elongatum TaxID=258515 RepID=A0A1G9UJZ8_9FIRM|nr:stage V sporulation protein AC [Acetanaerobacterium elongatum]SDM60218.1 stage V sporulation protein AC [Acetanaerobacterium elongatum]